MEHVKYSLTFLNIAFPYKSLKKANDFKSLFTSIRLRFWVFNGVGFSVTFWSFWWWNPAGKFGVKSWFVLFKLVFWLYIWIQNPKKTPRSLLLCRVTHQTCDFNEFLPNFREIRLKNPPEKLPKSLTKDNSIFNSLDKNWKWKRLYIQIQILNYVNNNNIYVDILLLANYFLNHF